MLAVYSPAAQQFLEQGRFDHDDIHFHPASNSVTGRHLNQLKEIKLTGDKAQPAILGLIMAAATVIDSGQNRGMSSNDAYDSTLPLSTVLAFYDVDRNDPDALAALARDKGFAHVSSPQRVKSEKARGEQTLRTFQRLIGDIYDRNELGLRLQLILDRLDSEPSDQAFLQRWLDESVMSIKPGSSYAQAHHCAEDAVVSLAQFIHASGRPVPTTHEALRDLKLQLNNDADIFLADSLLAESYSRAVQQHPKPSAPVRIEVPAHSVMGAWLTLYRDHLEQPQVVQWMHDQGIDPATVVITAATGTLSAKVKGQTRVFTLDDDSGWHTLASPLIAAAKVIAPGPQQPLPRPLGNPAFAATEAEIGAFYGETPNPDASRLATLKAQGGFGFPPADEALKLTSRSLKSLARHEQLAAAHFEKLAKAAAEKARLTREKERYTQLLSSTGQALPVVRQEAKRWAEKLIFEQTGWTVNADEIFLNRFRGMPSETMSATGWEHLSQEPSSSLALPDALLKNFSEQDWLPGELDVNAGLYKVGRGHGQEGYGLHNQFPMAPSQLMKAAWKTDFQGQFTQQLDTFWNTHRDDYRACLKGEFVSQARQQLKAYNGASAQEKQKIPEEQRLTRDDYRHIMAAVAGNLPLDENQPLTLEHLKAEAPVERSGASVHALVINGAISSDIVRLSKLAGGRQILYIPGNKPAFLCFKSITDMDKWIADQGNAPEKRKKLASHFRLKDRQDDDGFWRDVGTFITGNYLAGKGVDTSLKNIGSGYWSNQEHVVIDDQNVKIQGDLFSTMANIAQERMASDADICIKSNSEVTRDTWLNDMTVAAGLLAKFAPVGEPLVVALAAGTGLAELALGAEKAADGDTSAERSQGVSHAIDGALNTLFSATSLSDGAIEDPFDIAIEPLSPTTHITRPPLKRDIALRTETFADGTRALSTETPLSEHAYTLPRANGFDVIDENHVYRYDPKTPGVMSDLQASDDLKELDEFEAYCPAPVGGRAKRGVSDTCFVRSLKPVKDPLQQELQALEHVRLYPSAKKLLKRDRLTVFERRLYKVSDDKLVSVPRTEPVNYKHAIRGSVVNDKQFGLYDGTANAFLNTETRVVKLGAISDSCNDSREVRGVVVASPVKGDASKYLVVEADIGEFYYVKLDELKKPDALFIKCVPTDFDKALAKGYRNALYRKQTPPGTSLDNRFIALPKLDTVYKQLEKAGYAKGDVDALKARCEGMNAEQKREIAYQLRQRGTTGVEDAALSPVDVRPLVKPAGFDSLTPAQQNGIYAQQALQSVQKDLQATGLGPGNVVRSAADRARAEAANTVVNWLRQTRNPRTLLSGKSVVKAGAGNCGEMAALSREIINTSGGRAYEWFAGDSHAFTVVGGPSNISSGSVRFDQPEWADAWVVDPWAGIACPAAQYTQKLGQTMRKWAADGWVIRTSTDDAMSPTNKQWLDALIAEPKKPYAHGYSTERTPQIKSEPRIVVPRPLPAPQTVEVSMGYSQTVEDTTSTLSTRYLSDCSALAVLTDLKDGVYQKRTLMHLTGSSLELGLLDQNVVQLLEKLNKSLDKGGKVIFVGGLDSHSTVGMGVVLGQEHSGRKPLLDILRKPGVDTVIAGSSGIDIKPDGTFTLMQDRGKGVFDAATIKDVFDFAT
ncbi:dermonecrotic toxin domain-containing protein [Pseudomonas kairouanensis]|nr:DUF6543 domain-containing protein [Pseudomonas kairouanensis]